MSKKEDFKSFVSNHPNLIQIVKSKKHTWQDLYEVFDLYGSNEVLWDKYLNTVDNVKQTGTGSISELTKIFKNINIDNIQKYIDTAQRAIGIVQELTGSNATINSVGGPSTPRPINKIFED